MKALDKAKRKEEVQKIDESDGKDGHTKGRKKKSSSENSAGKDEHKKERKKNSSHENSDQKERNKRDIENKENSRKESQKVREEQFEKKEAETTGGEEDRRSPDKDLLYPMRARKDNVLANQSTSRTVESIQKSQSNKVEVRTTKSDQRIKKADQFSFGADQYIAPPDGFGDQPDSGDLMRESNERLISYIEKVETRNYQRK